MRQTNDYTETTAAPADRVELMVHGVGGTPPESMLDSDVIDRVRGDAKAAFFRRREASEEGGYLQEAYSWGGLTSRSASRAFWIVLAPFAFLNVAGWMLPSGRDHQQHHRIATSLLRLLGFMVTVHSIIWIGQMSVDFAGWQCGADPTCRSTSWFVSIFGWDWFLAAPGRRMVVGMIGPLVALGVLLILTRRVADRYETVTVDALADYGDDPLDPAERNSFADPTFWRRGESLQSFASLHLGGALAGITWLVAWSFAWLQPSGTPGLQYGLGVIAFMLLVAAGIGIAIVRDPEPAVDHDKEGLLPLLVRWHWMVTAAVLGLTLVAGIFWPGYEDPARTGPLDPYGDLWRLLWVATIVILLAFCLVVYVHPARRRSVASPTAAQDESEVIPVGFGSIGSIVAALFGFLISVVMLAGFGAATARLLGGRSVISYSYLYDAFGLVAVAWVIVLLAAFAVAWLTRDKVTVELLESEVADGFGEDTTSFATGPRRKRSWLVSVRRMRDLRSFIPRAESILGVMVLVAFSVALVIVAVQMIAPDAVMRAVEWFKDPLVTGSAWVVAVGVPTGMIVIMRRAYGSRQSRKSIGTLWDVVTFWPRWFHPLAPPSYSGRAIPELRTRLDYLVGSPSGTDAAASVAVTAHSQGSVIALAALDGLRGQTWIEHVSLLTHGSPITRLYLRYFPAHLPAPIARMHDSLGIDRWVNLYRLTDPIGGAISGEAMAARKGAWQPGCGLPISTMCPDGSGTHADPVADPDLRLFSEAGSDGSPAYPKKGDTYPPPLGHSGYSEAPEFQTAIRRLLGLPY